MIMPDLGGGEVYDHIRDIQPNVKAILATGYSIDGEAARILKRGCDGVIQKPFSIDRLSRIIHSVLKSDPGAGSDLTRVQLIFWSLGLKGMTSD